MVTHLRLMKHHLPHGITQHYLQPNVSSVVDMPAAPLNNSQTDCYLIYLQRMDEKPLYVGGWLHSEMAYLSFHKRVTHPSQTKLEVR